MIAHSRLSLSLSLGLGPHRCSPLSAAARVISHSRIVECVAVKLGASESVALRLQQLPGEARAHDEQDQTNCQYVLMVWFGRWGHSLPRYTLPYFFWCLPALRASSCNGWVDGNMTSDRCGLDMFRFNHVTADLLCSARLVSQQLTSLYHDLEPEAASSSGGACCPSTEMHAHTRSRTAPATRWRTSVSP